MSTKPAQMHMYTTSPLTNTDTIFLESVNTLAQLSCSLHHPQNEMSQTGGHGQANPETVKDQHTSFIAEIIRNQNKMPDMSKVLLQMVGASVASFLPLAYQSPSTSTGASLGLLPKVVSINLCIATIVLLIGIILRELKPRLAKVIEKLGSIAFHMFDSFAHVALDCLKKAKDWYVIAYIDHDLPKSYSDKVHICVGSSLPVFYLVL